MTPRLADEHGQAIVVVMTLVGLLGAVALGLVVSSSTDLRIASAFARGVEAEAAAEAGIARALADLARQPDWTLILNGTLQSTFSDGATAGTRALPGGVFVDLDLTQSLATCGHAPPCADADRSSSTAERPWGANNPRWRLFAWGPLAALIPGTLVAPPAAYVVVLVGDDPAETDGNPDLDEPAGSPGSGLLRLRAEAFAAGGARRVVEVLVARPPVGPGVRVLRWSRQPG